MKADVQRDIHTTEKERIAMLAHDLRAPMSCVAGAAQIALLQAKQGKAVDEQLRQILQAVASMDGMLSRLCGEQGEGMRTDACRLERELRSLIAPRAAVKGMRVSMDLSALYGRALPYSYDSLLRVLSNLLINAVKFTQVRGSVTLRAMLVRGGDGDGTAVFTVSDSGIGMKKEFMNRMYDAHERAQESSATPGKGLGLAIVRRLVLEMGGEIDAASEWGKGTIFTLRLPLHAHGVLQ